MKLATETFRFLFFKCGKAHWIPNHELIFHFHDVQVTIHNRSDRYLDLVLKKNPDKMFNNYKTTNQHKPHFLPLRVGTCAQHPWQSAKPGTCHWLHKRVGVTLVSSNSSACFQGNQPMKTQKTSRLYSKITRKIWKNKAPDFCFKISNVSNILYRN